MSKEAEKLAEVLDNEFVMGRISNHSGRKAAALLRRQAEQIKELREALEFAKQIATEYGLLSANGEARINAALSNTKE